MQLVEKFGFASIAMLAVGAIGCTLTEEAGPEESGNAALGIARFEVEETAIKTTVIGLDTDGYPIGRLDLVHGRFALSEGFKDDYETAEVDGRKLDVTVMDHSFVWEGAGYEPLLHMPAAPASEMMIARFLADPHVKPVLDRWQLGFEATPDADDEQAYIATHTNVAGSLVATCNGQATCGADLVRTGVGAGTYPVNTCGSGTVNALQATRIVMDSDTTLDNLHQCCPAGSGGLAYRWWAQKKCPKVDNSTSCGTTGGACKACGQWNATQYCDVDHTGTAVDSWYNATTMGGGFICEDGAQCTSGTCSGGVCADVTEGLADGEMCWDNGVDYGACASGICLNPATGLCKYWETCYCGGVYP